MEEESKGQVLSQEEVDALLSVVSENGEVLEPEGRLKGTSEPQPYDFRSPEQFSREQMRALQMMHESLARRLSSSLSAYLRTTVRVGFNHIEQGSYADFMAHMENPIFISILSMDPLPGRMFLSMDLRAFSAIIDRLLGGPGTPLVRSRDITDIELALVDDIIDIVIDALQTSWRTMVRLQPRLDDINLNPQFVQIALPADNVVLVVLDFSFREVESRLSFCIPYSVLKPIAFMLSPYALVAAVTEAEERKPAEESTTLGEYLRKVTVPVSVHLGSAEIDLQGLLYLQPGDVICLDTSVRHRLKVLAGDRVKFLGRPGQVGSHLAIKVSDILAENGSPARGFELPSPTGSNYNREEKQTEED